MDTMSTYNRFFFIPSEGSMSWENSENFLLLYCKSWQSSLSRLVPWITVELSTTFTKMFPKWLNILYYHVTCFSVNETHWPLYSLIWHVKYKDTDNYIWSFFLQRDLSEASKSNVKSGLLNSTVSNQWRVKALGLVPGVISNSLV